MSGEEGSDTLHTVYPDFLIVLVRIAGHLIVIIAMNNSHMQIHNNLTLRHVDINQAQLVDDTDVGDKLYNHLHRRTRAHDTVGVHSNGTAGRVLYSSLPNHLLVYR